jgi:hypothetical protein
VNPPSADTTKAIEPEVPTDTIPKISVADTTMKSIRLSNDGEIVEEDSDFDFLIVYSKMTDILCIIHGNGKWVTSAMNGTHKMSIDGITWEDMVISGNGYPIKLICYGNNKFVGARDIYVHTWISDDAIVWSDERWGFPIIDAHSIKYYDGKFFIVGGDGYTPSHFLMSVSTDGITWTNYEYMSIIYQVDMAYNGSLYVAVGYNYGCYSSNGTFWTKGGTSSGGNAIVWGNDIFVTVGNAGVIRTTTNGSTWTSRTSGTTQDLRAVCAAQ